MGDLKSSNFEKNIWQELPHSRPADTKKSMSHTTKNGYNFVSKYDKGWEWKPRKVIYEVTDEPLTSFAGVSNLIDLFYESQSYERLLEFIPERKSNSSIDSRQYAMTFLSGFWYGADCLDDHKEFKLDPALEARLGEAPSPKSLGNWLRDFSEEGLKSGAEFLTEQALEYHKKIESEHGADEEFVMDMDSTPHIQFGKRIEGTGPHYKGLQTPYCYESLSVYDQYGLSLYGDLRGGNTFSSVGAEDVICELGPKIRRALSAKKRFLFRGDSAFNKQQVIKALMAQGFTFVIASHDRTHWEEKARGIPMEQWEEWGSGAEEFQAKKFVGEMSEAEIKAKTWVTSFTYFPKWADEKLAFRIVVKKQFKEDRKGQEDLFEGNGKWEYFSVTTNMGALAKTDTEILKFYQARGMSENYIREEKYNFDLKHFPCLKLNANKAYFLMAKIGYNFIRCSACLLDPKGRKFAKSFRRFFVCFPGKIVKHARTMRVKINRKYLEEVNRLRRAWTGELNVPAIVGRCNTG